LISDNHRIVEFKVTPEKQLRGVLAIFCKIAQAAAAGAIAFTYGGQRLFGDETPAELQMSDGDCIFAETSLDPIV
jgi:Ubiquitin-2 like Rad60 SUMO-like